MKNLAAWTLLEIVFLIVILGILGIGILSNMNDFKETNCVRHLSARLIEARQHIDIALKDSFLNHRTFDLESILSALSTQTQADKINHTAYPCAFDFTTKTLNAKIGDKSVKFSITDFDIVGQNIPAPKIYCTLSNPICKDFFNKKLDK